MPNLPRAVHLAALLQLAACAAAMGQATASSTEPGSMEAPDCECYWMDGQGTAQEAHFRPQHAWSLHQFVRHWPDYSPGRPSSPPPAIRWHPLGSEPLPELTPLGSLGGTPVYQVRYSPAGLVLVTEVGDWQFCPLWIFYGRRALVAGVDDAKIFSFEGHELLAVRIFSTGMGANQQSIFFGLVDGRPVHLRFDRSGFEAYVEAGNWRLHHRGGGFISRTLIWQQQAWKRDHSEGGTMHVRYRIEGNRLVFDRAGLVPESDVRPKHDLRQD